MICMDNLLTGRKENIASLLECPTFTFIDHDVIEPLPYLEVDEIYHLACAASPSKYQKDPLHTLKTCFIGSWNVLELARASRAKILFSSTSEVYGDPEMHPQKESYWGRVNPVGPRSCYDEGKRCAESLFMAYRNKFGLDIRIARIFNTYGPRMDLEDGRVIANFIKQGLKNDPITIYGSGNQSRSFCYIDDMLSGLVAFMECQRLITHPVNFGNPCEEYSILETAHLVLQILQSHSTITFHPLPVDDPAWRRPDISLAARLLHFSPKISLEKGLSETVKYFLKSEEIIP